VDGRPDWGIGAIPEFQRVLSSATPDEIFVGIQNQAAELGFEYCLHGMRMTLPITKPRTTSFANYPPEWLEHYRNHGYHSLQELLGQNGTQEVRCTCR
jgi:hypothetical protein